jgi:hypothetical protein
MLKKSYREAIAFFFYAGVLALLNAQPIQPGSPA